MSQDTFLSHRKFYTIIRANLIIITIITIAFFVLSLNVTQQPLPSRLFQPEFLSYAIVALASVVLARQNLSSLYDTFPLFQSFIRSLKTRFILVYMTLVSLVGGLAFYGAFRPILGILKETRDNLDGSQLLWLLWVGSITLVIMSMFARMLQKPFSKFLKHETASAEHVPVSNQRLIICLILAMVLGLVAGYLRPSLHVAVEQGQVLAGVIDYSEPNPFGMYQYKLWNGWGHLSAIGLHLGFSEIFLSHLLSSVAGMIFFAGAAMITLAVTNSIKFSLINPILAYMLSAQVFEFGYPLLTMSTQHTYGMLGLTSMCFILSLFVFRKNRIGFFLLGFAPLIHASLGVWLHVLLACYILMDIKHIRRWVYQGLYVLPGYVVCGITIIVQRTLFPIPSLSSESQQAYLPIVNQYFDVHRSYNLSLTSPEFVYLATVVMICIVILSRFSYLISSYIRFILRMMVIASFIGITGYLYTQSPLPGAELLAILIPNRFINIVLLLYTILYVPLVVWIVNQVYDFFTKSDTYPSLAFDAQQIKTPLSIILFVGVLGVDYYTHFNQFDLHLEDAYGHIDKPIYLETSNTEGLLLVGPRRDDGFHMAQLLHQRPVVLDPYVLNILPYTIEAVPYTIPILQDIYDVDFYNMTELTSAILPSDALQHVWESRTTQEWQQLGERHHFTQIVVIPGWTLQLPLAAQNDDGTRLYDVLVRS